MNYKINFNEPIPQMVDRLKQEHASFELTLEKIQKHIDQNDIKRAIGLIYNINEVIIKHSLEEEGRIMRVILEKVKEESSESVRIIQEHKWITDF